MKNGLTKMHVKFKAERKPYEFIIYHNMPELPGLSFKEAFYNWVYRTKDYTDKSFSDYVKSKNTGHIVLTQEEYDKL